MTPTGIPILVGMSHSFTGQSRATGSTTYLASPLSAGFVTFGSLAFVSLDSFVTALACALSVTAVGTAADKLFCKRP